MMRYLRGTVVLGIVALVGACNSEPSELEGGDAARLVVTPQQIFIDQEDTEGLLVRVEDDQGAAVVAPVTISNISGGITVEGDSAFRPIFNADGDLVYNPTSTEFRIFVTGDELVAGGFTVSAGGFTEEVAVTVLPNELDVTFSNETPAIGELVTLTAPPLFRFNPDSEVEFAIGEAITYEVAADGTTLTFLPLPGSAGAITVTHVTPTYSTGLSLDFAASTTAQVSLESPYSTEDPNTAPTIVSGLAIGDSVLIYDAAYAVNQFSHIEITEAGTVLDIELDWDGSADIDMVVCNADCSDYPGIAGFAGATGSHPEHITVEFENPGTYTLYNNVYGGTQGGYYRIRILRVPPPPPES